jgi:hypothetical protein
MSNRSYEPAGFLNVDLVVDSRSPLDPLVSALERGTALLYHGRFERNRRAVFRAVFELAGRYPTGPEVAIRRFAALVDRLPRGVRTVFRRASRRTFDIGVRGGFGRPPLELEVGATALRLVAALDARILFTVYEPGLVSEGLDALLRREVKRSGRAHKRSRTNR